MSCYAIQYAKASVSKALASAAHVVPWLAAVIQAAGARKMFLAGFPGALLAGGCVIDIDSACLRAAVRATPGSVLWRRAGLCRPLGIVGNTVPHGRYLSPLPPFVRSGHLGGLATLSHPVAAMIGSMIEPGQ